MPVLLQHNTDWGDLQQPQTHGAERAEQSAECSWWHAAAARPAPLAGSCEIAWDFTEHCCPGWCRDGRFTQSIKSKPGILDWEPKEFFSLQWPARKTSDPGFFWSTV